MIYKQKSVVVFAIIVLIIFVFSVKETYSQYAGCLPCDQPSTMQYVQKWAVVLPQFPNCPVDISYWILKCPGSEVAYISSLSWSLAYTTGSNCDDLINSFVKSNPDGSKWIDWNAFNQISMFAFEEISLQLFETKDPALYPCPNSFSEVKYVKTYCSAYRIILYFTFSPAGLFQINFRCWEAKPCAIGGCCTYTNKYCYDANGNIQITPIDEYSGTCPPQPPPTFLCQPQPGDFVYESGCQAWCQPR
jgi:hypothetical protein